MLPQKAVTGHRVLVFNIGTIDSHGLFRVASYKELLMTRIYYSGTSSCLLPT